MKTPTSIGVLPMLRRTHEERVLGILRKHGAVSRADLVELTRLSRPTLSEIIAHLIRRGAVTTSKKAPAGQRIRGRPTQLISLDPRTGQVIGVDLARRHGWVVIANAAHEILVSESVPYGSHAPWHRRVTAVIKLIDQRSAEMGMRLDVLDGIGVGLTGPVPATATRRCDEVRTAFEDHFGTRVLVDNNTRFAALAEAVWGRASDVDDVVYIRLSDGVGGGLVLGGRLFRGGSGAAGEMGHIKVVPGGRRCTCGSNGCLEAYVSVPALVTACNDVLPGSVKFDDVIDATEAGHDRVVEIVTYAGTLLGEVLAYVSNTLNPSCVVVGGEVVRLGETLLKPARAALRDNTLPLAHRGVDIRTAGIDADGGALGAIAAIFHESPLLVGYPELAAQGPSRPSL